MSKIRHIFRWDLDKTYLKTDFDSVRGLVRTARANATQRENIPGSASLIRGIRRDGRGLAPFIYFVSGSPEQLRKVLEEKFAIDGFKPDGFVLKPTLSDIFKGRFRTVTTQVGYKLSALLAGRADSPIGSKETLVGDDAESDILIYSLYADLIAGRVTRDHLAKVLRKAGAYPNQIEAIEADLEAVVHEPAVERILIHIETYTPPAAFADYFPLAIPIYNHLQTALVLYLDGRVSGRTVASVVLDLVEAYGYDGAKLINSGEDLLRRRRPLTGPEPFERLPDELRKEAKESLPDDVPREVVEQRALVLEELANRAELVRSRTPARSAPDITPDRDYVALFERDLLRREEAKKLRKQKGSKPPEPEAVE